MTIVMRQALPVRNLFEIQAHLCPAAEQRLTKTVLLRRLQIFKYYNLIILQYIAMVLFVPRLPRIRKLFVQPQPTTRVNTRRSINN